MRLLTLVRHAKSSWETPGLEDFDRPLNPRGQRDAPAMARRLRLQGARPDRLGSSPALRAISTARSFAEVLGMDAAQILLRPQIYEASPQTLLKVLQKLDDADQHVMLFGHNPGFSQLAHLLARCSFDELPTCGIAQLEVAAKSWQEVTPDCARVLGFLYPKDGGG